MKKTFAFGLLWIATVACDPTRDRVPQMGGNSVQVGYRLSKSVTVPGQILIVNTLEIKDNRCPTDVICVHAGNADVELSISDGMNKAHVPVSFNMITPSTGNAIFKLGVKKYALTINEILPYPEANQKTRPEEYKINLCIEKI